MSIKFEKKKTIETLPLTSSIKAFQNLQNVS